MAERGIHTPAASSIHELEATTTPEPRSPHELRNDGHNSHSSRQSTADAEAAEESAEPLFEYLKGWRLHVLTTAYDGHFFENVLK